MRQALMTEVLSQRERVYEAAMHDPFWPEGPNAHRDGLTTVRPVRVRQLRSCPQSMDAHRDRRGTQGSSRAEPDCLATGPHRRAIGARFGASISYPVVLEGLGDGTLFFGV